MGPGVGLFGAPSRCHERFCAPLAKRKTHQKFTFKITSKREKGSYSKFMFEKYARNNEMKNDHAQAPLAQNGAQEGIRIPSGALNFDL